MPTPRAAMMPTILPTSTGSGRAGALPVVAAAVTSPAAAASRSSAALAFEAANRATCSSTSRTNFL